MKKKIIFEKNNLTGWFPEFFQVEYENKYNFLSRKNKRFDYEDEWNNLGYGKIIASNKSVFSISTKKPDYNFSEILAYVKDEEGNIIVPYLSIIENDESATLWFNREAGPVDGLDYYIIEDFLENYKINKFGSTPILSEIPFGYSSAVTMRIDCDEDIASGKHLFDLYNKLNIPFSMAIKTSLDLNGANLDFINEVIDSNGAILSHSNSHKPNWGGTRESAKQDALIAKEKLQAILPENYNLDYVVSPFHQNPQYAIQGLVDAGIKGFIGGSIKFDQEYLQARAGYVTSGEPIITHSQQCMLHGDCYRDSELSIYKQSFNNHYKTNTFFGFLDHPFSDYKYGWKSEEERVNAHREFLVFLKSYDNVWFANLIDSMNFLWVKSNTKIWVENDQLKWKIPEHQYNIPNMKVFWKGKEIEIK